MARVGERFYETCKDNIVDAGNKEHDSRVKVGEKRKGTHAQNDVKKSAESSHDNESRKIG